jgi:mitochondrial fission protein ELM1
MLRMYNEASGVPRVQTPAAMPPRTWVLASHHAGDNTQLLALADNLGWPAEIKRCVYRSYQTLARLVLGATLIGLDRRRSSPIASPYPDLIIGAGRPTEAIALWVRRHGNPAVRLVYLGTPWASLDSFDLVITTPQYRLPVRPNVLHNALPLHCIVPSNVAAAALAWRPRLNHLPRPWIVVLVGGASGPYTFDSTAAARLARQASALAETCGGSLLVTTSARTSSPAADTLAATISAPSYFFWWTPESAENPLEAYLALGDKFIVTADSISMIAEACTTGKPVMLYDIERDRQSMRAEEHLPPIGDRLPAPYWRGRDLATTGFRLAMRYGPPPWSRDLRIVHRRLIESGLVSWLGDPPPLPRPAPQSHDMSRAVARIHGLFGLSG